MPELGLSKSSFINELLDKRKHGQLSKNPISTIETTALLHDLQPIGAGVESVVMQHPRRDNLVVAVHHTYDRDKHTNLSAKLTYYYHNILASLYPNNFPRISASFGNNDQWLVIPGTVRERIEKGSRRYLFHKKTYPFSRVRKEWKKAGMKLEIDRVRPFSNFITTKDGKEYYVDLVKISPDQIPQLEQTVNHVLENNHYPEEVVKKVRGYVKRLQELVPPANTP